MIDLREVQVFTDPYVTYDNRYIESVWWLLSQIYQKGLLYKGYTIQPYSLGVPAGLAFHLIPAHGFVAAHYVFDGTGHHMVYAGVAVGSHTSGPQSPSDSFLPYLRLNSKNFD